MTDVVDMPTRSRMMSGIGSRNTKPEVDLRRALHALGLRFRLHLKNLPGSPDIVLPRFRAVILVHGCFWHRHAGCRFASTPASRRDFWKAKFDANVLRDKVVQDRLVSQGWRVAIVWECSLRKPDQVSSAASYVSTWLAGDEAILEVGSSD